VLHKWWEGREWSEFVSLGMPVSGDAEPEPLASTGAITALHVGSAAPRRVHSRGRRETSITPGGRTLESPRLNGPEVARRRPCSRQQAMTTPQLRARRER